MNSLDKSREGIGLGLFAVSSLTALGLLILNEVTNGETIGGVATILSILERMAAVLVTLSVSIYAVVEGTAMLYEKYAKRRFQEGKQVGVLEGLEQGLERGLERGRAQMDMAWRSWLERRDQALADGEPFDEPPPSAAAPTNGA